MLAEVQLSIFRQFSSKSFSEFSCQKKFSIDVKGTLHERPLSRRMQKRFLKKRSPLSKKKLEQAGRPEHEFRRRVCDLSVAHLKIDAAPLRRTHSPRRPVP